MSFVRNKTLQILRNDVAEKKLRVKVLNIKYLYPVKSMHKGIAPCREIGGTKQQQQSNN